MVSVVIYIFCFSLGLGAVPWLMMSEIFPVRIRGLASSFATLFNWTCSFIVTETFNSMIEAMTEQGVFWFYGGVCICGMLYVLFYVPETKVRPLFLHLQVGRLLTAVLTCCMHACDAGGCPQWMLGC